MLYEVITREAEHHVVGTAGIAHQPETPDLAGQRPESGADFEIEFRKQRAPYQGFIHTFT